MLFLWICLAFWLSNSNRNRLLGRLRKDDLANSHIYINFVVINKRYFKYDNEGL